MAYYQVYLLDQQERICKRIDCDCADDAAALAAARHHLGLRIKAEVWIGIRMVGQVHASGGTHIAGAETAPTRHVGAGMLPKLALLNRMRPGRPGNTDGSAAG